MTRGETSRQQGKLALRRPHFAHDSKQKVFEGKCIYSNETYRHKVAKEILQKLMKVRVPMVVKYPQNEIEGPPYMLSPARTIEAHSVSIEMPFFEDNDGAIRYGKNVDLSAGTGRSLLIQPDVTFFNAEGNPILFIEIVATHKPDINKLLKIRKLGINTIQVSIPKDVEEEIERTFSHVGRTKWVFNYEQAKTEYIRPAERDGEGIPPIDAFQTAILAGLETFECKKFALNEFIRRIRKIMGSGEFREFEEGLIEEIRHVESNTARYRNEWRELQGRIDRGLRDEFQSKEAELRKEEKLFEAEEEEFGRIQREFTRESADLGRRYSDQKREIDDAQRGYRPGCQSEITRIENDFKRLGTGPNELRERIEKLRIEESRLEQEYFIDAERIEDSKRRAREVNTGYKRRGEELSSQHSETEERLRGEFQKQIRDVEQQEFILEQEAVEFEARIKHGFAERNSELVRAIKEGNSRRVSGISRGIRILLETRQYLSNIRQGERDYTRLRKIEEILNSEDYKHWPKL